jgi:hypothetical protein
MKTIRVLAIWAFLPAVYAQSQLGTGAIGGVVTDASGNSAAAAVVRVTSEDTGLTRQTVSSATGDFSIPVLPTGHY